MNIFIIMKLLMKRTREEDYYSHATRDSMKNFANDPVRKRWLNELRDHATGEVKDSVLAALLRSRTDALFVTDFELDALLHPGTLGLSFARCAMDGPSGLDLVPQR